jgi:dipeptidyl aminopeptidase/acylaminoacyl peptidase
MAQFDISAAGHLVFLPGSDQGLGFAPVALALADRAGSMTRVDVPPGPFVHVRASPEGTHLALDSDDGDEAVVWIYELGGANALRRLTVGGRNQFPVWSPDGQHVVFQSDREGDQAIFVQRADGVGGTERLTTPDDGEEHVPESWSPDGQPVSFSVAANSSYSLWSCRSKTAGPRRSTTWCRSIRSGRCSRQTVGGSPTAYEQREPTPSRPATACLSSC